MKKIIYLILMIVAFNDLVQAQTGSVGIGTAAPNTNASLELGAANKGLLLNRVALISADVATPLSAHVAGMIAYNTATAGTSPNNVSPGIYYNNGTRWIRFEPSSARGLFVKSAGTQVINGAAVITDWVVTTNDFGSAWNGSVFTVPAGMQGWYSISAGYSAAQGYGGGLRTPHQHVIIRVNGSVIIQGAAAVSVTGGVVNGDAPGTGTANASGNYYLNAGDQVTIMGNHLSYLLSNDASTPAPAEPLYTYLSVLKQ
jgi:hypothetical protein